VPVIALNKLPETLKTLEARGCRPDALILARPRHDLEQHVSFEDLIKLGAEQGLELLRLPDMLEMRGVNSEIQVRPVKLEDLLQRPPITLDSARISEMIHGRTVLITGAGGSIGSELARQVAAFGPARLILLDANEFLLYSVEVDLGVLFPEVPKLAVLCNVRERDAVERILLSERPDVVFHAAALKHVTMVEAQPLEGLFTNAIGTRNVAEAAIKSGAKAFILVSTDKAVNPTNVMGATKRLAEMFCQAVDLDVDGQKERTRFVTVRFGNVLGSAGSVVPLFEKQLKSGGPLTVTHPHIERFFMTIPEACILVLQSAAYGLANPSERGRIFVLDMGPPVKIADLARNLIRLAGMRPDVDVKIVYTGLRPGEKMFEELFDQRETLAQTSVEGILMAFPRTTEHALVCRIFDELKRLIEARDLPAALRLLASAVPEYKPGPEVLTLIGEKAPAPVLNQQPAH
jgi:O-antigen biosynthesis protein WbqV